MQRDQNGIVCIFVTDYSLHPHVGDFFSAELADRVLKIEMNDEAADLGVDMNAGDYWFLNNTRVKVSSQSGLMEGRLREKGGVRKLDPNDLLNEAHFQALLQCAQLSTLFASWCSVVLTELSQTQGRVENGEPVLRRRLQSPADRRSQRRHTI